MRKLILLCFLFQLCIAYGQWEKTSWKNESPLGIKFYDKYFIVLSSLDGYLLSTDGAESWQNIGNIFQGSNAIIASNDKIYFGGLGFLNVTTDMGKSWSTKVKGLPSDYIVLSLLRVDSSIIAGTNKGAYICSDTDNIWRSINNGIKTKGINALAIIGNVIFACSDDLIFTSTNMGELWTESIPDTNKTNSYDGFIIDEGNVYLFTNCDTYNGDKNSLYLSNDTGQTWIRKENVPFKDAFTYSITACNNNVIVTTISGYRDSVFFSTDKGTTWITLNEELPRQLQKGIDGLIKSGNNILACSGSELYISTDCGLHWQNKIKSFNFTSVECLRTIGNLLFAGSGDPGGTMAEFSDGIFTSSDNGDSWTPNGLKNLVVECIDNSGNQIIAGTNYGVYFSSDMGYSWVEKNSDLPKKEYVWSLAFHKDIIFLPYHRDSLIASADLGNTWIDKNKGLPFIRQEIHTIESYKDGLFIGTDSAIYLSNDLGESWQILTRDLPPRDYIFSCIQLNNDSIYAVSKYGLYFSHDMGNTWSLISNGLPDWSDGKNYPCKIELLNSAIIAIISSSSTKAGVFYTCDNGENWIEKNEGITNSGRVVSSVAIANDYIFVGTNSYRYGSKGDAIYRANKINLTGIIETKNKDNGLFLSPNPTRDYLYLCNSDNFTYSTLKYGADDKIVIYNSSGEVVISIKPQNSVSQTIDVSALPCGFYFARYGKEFGKFVKK